MRVASAILIAGMAITGSAASAQNDIDDPLPYGFFGFEYYLSALSYKWACGGAYRQDIDYLSEMATQFSDKPGASQTLNFLSEAERRLEADEFSLDSLVSPSGDMTLRTGDRTEICGLALKISDLPDHFDAERDFSNERSQGSTVTRELLQLIETIEPVAVEAN